MRLKRAIVISIVLLAVSGCASGSGPTTLECPTWLKPITLSLDDVLTAPTELEILNHNDKFEAFCR